MDKFTQNYQMDELRSILYRAIKDRPDLTALLVPLIGVSDGPPIPKPKKLNKKQRIQQMKETLTVLAMKERIKNEARTEKLENHPQKVFKKATRNPY